MKQKVLIVSPFFNFEVKWIIFLDTVGILAVVKDAKLIISISCYLNLATVYLMQNDLFQFIFLE